MSTLSPIGSTVQRGLLGQIAFNHFPTSGVTSIERLTLSPSSSSSSSTKANDSQLCFRDWLCSSRPRPWDQARGKEISTGRHQIGFSVKPEPRRCVQCLRFHFRSRHLARLEKAIKLQRPDAFPSFSVKTLLNYCVNNYFYYFDILYFFMKHFWTFYEAKCRI